MTHCVPRAGLPFAPALHRTWWCAVASEGASGEPIETVLMGDLRIDVPESQLGPFR